MIATNKAVYSCFIGDNTKKVCVQVLTTMLLLSLSLSLQIQIGEFGCELNCCTLTDYTQDYKFVIGTPDLVQFFTPDLPAQCKAFEGNCQHLN